MNQPHVSGLTAPYPVTEGWAQEVEVGSVNVAESSNLAQYGPIGYPEPSNEAVPPLERRKHACSFPGCEKSFTTSGHLARHARTHTGEKRFQCTFPGCQSKFSRHDNMLQHYRSHLSRNSRRRKTIPTSASGGTGIGSSTVSSTSSRPRSAGRSTGSRSAASVSPLVMPFQSTSLGTVSPTSPTVPLSLGETDRIQPQTIDMRRPYARSNSLLQPGYHYAEPRYSQAAASELQIGLQATPERVINHRHSYSALSSHATDPLTPGSGYSTYSADELDSEGYFELQRPQVFVQQHHPHSADGSSQLPYAASPSPSTQSLPQSTQPLPQTYQPPVNSIMYTAPQGHFIQPSFVVPPPAQATQVQWYTVDGLPQNTVLQPVDQLYTYCDYVAPAPLEAVSAAHYRPQPPMQHAATFPGPGMGQAHELQFESASGSGQVFSAPMAMPGRSTVQATSSTHSDLPDMASSAPAASYTWYQSDLA